MTLTAFNASALLILAMAAVAGVCIGTVPLDARVVLDALASTLLPYPLPFIHDVSAADHAIVWLIRLPRVAVGATVGAGLATAGVVMQGLFRNRLAEPGLLGVGPGAILGGVIAFVTGWAAHSAIALPIVATLSALAVLAGVYTVAASSGSARLTHLLLIGIAAGSLCTAVSSLLISANAAAWQSAQEIVFWMMGGIDARTWVHVWLSAPFVAVGLGVVIWKARDLDALALGEESAAALGVDVEVSTRLFIVTAALLTGVSVAVAGLLAFVGLVIPNGVRLIVGPRHRAVCVASALAGAVFVVTCDLIARTVHPPIEIRLGIITGLVGSPILIALLVCQLRSKGRS